jgi:biotin carboxyl carrier protein
MRWLVRLLASAAVVVLAVYLVTTYRRHQTRLAAQAARDQPVIAPSRVKDVRGEAVIVLDSGDVARLGLRTVVLQSSSSAPVRRLTGELIPEPDRITTVRAPIAGRLSVPGNSRWPSFGDRLTAGGEIAQVSDAKPLVLARGGVVTQVGAQPGEMVQAGQLLLEITDYDRPLARIAWPADAPAPPPEITLSFEQSAGTIGWCRTECGSRHPAARVSLSGQPQLGRSETGRGGHRVRFGSRIIRPGRSRSRPRRGPMGRPDLGIRCQWRPVPSGPGSNRSTSEWWLPGRRRARSRRHHRGGGS